MKKTIIMLLMALSVISANAQLQVDSYGNVQVHEAANCSEGFEPNAFFAVGEDPAYIWSDFYLHNIGIHSCLTPETYFETIGVYSEVWPANVNGSATTPPSIALYGLACGSLNRNFGVVGGLNSNYGAGVYGTTAAGPDIQLTGSYAGYFDGATFVNGNLTASAVYTLSDIRLKENVSLLSETAATRGSTLDNIQRMNVIEYNLKDAVKRMDANEKNSRFKPAPERSETEINRRHFGLSAQDLKEIYPDLVLEGQDGYLAVNYSELVPVLIRAIQELNDKLDEANGIIGARKAQGTTAVNSVGTGANVLYQNTPNPFKEQTTIRFSLADDAQSASICIFDMTGKMLKNLPVSSGDTSVSIGGWELGEGMFLYTLIVNGKEIDTKRMIITK